MTALSIDPRTRLFIIFSFTGCAVFFNSVRFLAALLFLTVVYSALFGKWSGVFRKRAGQLFVFFVFLTLIQSWFNPSGAVLLSTRGLPLITTGGLMQGARFLCRISVTMLSCTILLKATTREMIQGLVELKLPYELAFMASVSISFLPALAQDMQNSLTALELRGVDLKKTPLYRRIGVYFYLLQPVIKGIIVDARELSMAMELRAFRAYDTRGSYIVLALKKRDYAVMPVTPAGLAAAAWLLGGASL